MSALTATARRMIAAILLRIRRTSELMDKHLHEQPPRPSEFSEDIPPSVERVILRCLAKDAGERAPNMRKIIQKLTATREKEGTADGSGD